MSSNTFWVYKPSDKIYYVAKQNSFGMYEKVLDIRTGTFMLQLVQGVCTTAPAWDWVRRITDEDKVRIFAGFKDEIYDITELEQTYFARL